MEVGNVERGGRKGDESKEEERGKRQHNRTKRNINISEVLTRKKGKF